MVKRKINVFFGYQFLNSKINRIERESAYSEILENINNSCAKNEGFILLWKYWELKSNEYIGEQILHKIDESQILIFDLSEPNLNVFFELGYAIALSRQSAKQVILILHEEVQLNHIGSDLSGKYVLKVNEENIIPKLSFKILESVKEYMNYSQTEIVRAFWIGSKTDLFHIICPEIPIQLRTKFADTEDCNYLRYSKFADIDTLIHVKSYLIGLNKDLLIKDFTSNEYYQADEESQIVIGGPAWNRVSKEYQKNLPVRFVDGGDGNDDPLVIYDKGSSISYSPKEENGTLLHDISLFARISKGLQKVYLISGCRTLGVLGSAKVFLNSNNASINVSKINQLVGQDDFILIFKTEPLYGTVSNIVLNDSNMLALFKRNSAKDDYIKIL